MLRPIPIPQSPCWHGPGYDANNFSLITIRASDKCITEKQKTITGDDILVAMATLEFDNYIEPLKLYLQKYREVNS